MKVRVTASVLNHLDGGQAWSDAEQVESGLAISDYSGTDLAIKLRAAKARKDGSVTVDITDDEADDLYLWAEVMAMGARDNISYEPSMLGEFNAASGLMRQIEQGRTR